MSNDPDAPPPLFALAADPQRWRLLRELARSDRRVGELVTLLGKPQNVVSYHLAQLRRAGLVAARQSSADGRDAYYRLDIAGYREALRTAGAGLHAGVRFEPGHAPVLAGRGGRGGRVLFLCTGNSARSQMAEALLAHRSAGSYEARSAGSHPKPVHPQAVSTMAAHGIDIAHHRSKHLTRFTSTRFDRVITLCDRVREVCPEFPRAVATAHWSVPDPSREPDAERAFAATAAELSERVDLLIGELSEHE